MKLGEQLKQLRLEKGYTQEELANKLFVTRQTISNWETEKGQPDIENIVLLAQTFDISIDELMTGKRLIISEKNAIGKKHFYCLDYLVNCIVGATNDHTTSNINPLADLCNRRPNHLRSFHV